MGDQRRKDKVHDIGDSMPGTVGDSKGTIHDQRGGPSFNPEDVTIPSETEDNHNTNTEDEPSDDTKQVQEQSNEKSTRMKYAEKYGDTWPEDRQRRFLREHNMSAKDMGLKPTE